MLITEQTFLNWQTRLRKGGLFKYWWQFWSNYSWLAIIPIFAYIYFASIDQYFFGEIIIAFVIARLFLVPIISKFHPTPRPYQRYKFEPLTSFFLSRRTEKQNSFPSSHVISIMASGGVMLLNYPVLGVLLLGIGVMTGLGRIVLSFHYPRDVVFSIIFGLIIGVFVDLLV